LAACLISLQSLPAAVVLMAGAVLAGGVSGRLRRLAATVAGGMCLPVAVLAWLAASGALPYAYDQVVTYDLAYRGLPSNLPWMAPLAAMLLGFILIPAGVKTLAMVLRREGEERGLWVCVLWVTSYAIYLAFQDRLFLHYLILAMPPLLLLASAGTSLISASLRQGRPVHRVGGVVLVGVITIAAMVSGVSMAGLYRLTIDRATDARASGAAACEWIAANTPASGSLYVWGFAPVLYLAADREPYDRYVAPWPLVTAGYWSASATLDLLATWQKSPPATIVEVPSSVPMLRSKIANGDDRDFDTLEALRDFVRAHYRLGSSTPGYDIYVYTGS
jgi:uncharacterized membrane protein